MPGQGLRCDPPNIEIRMKSNNKFQINRWNSRANIYSLPFIVSFAILEIDCHPISSQINWKVLQNDWIFFKWNLKKNELKSVKDSNLLQISGHICKWFWIHTTGWSARPQHMFTYMIHTGRDRPWYTIMWVFVPCFAL